MGRILENPRNKKKSLSEKAEISRKRRMRSTREKILDSAGSADSDFKFRRELDNKTFRGKKKCYKYHLR
jgi:hypothetical protein